VQGPGLGHGSLGAGSEQLTKARRTKLPVADRDQLRGFDPGATLEAAAHHASSMARPLGRVKLRSDNWLDEHLSHILTSRMFLERKFSSTLGGRQRFEPPVCPGLQGIDRTELPELVYDVVCNLQLLLAARRHYDHVLPDFGLSTSDGQTGLEARVERLQREVPETFARYERRFGLQQLDFDVDDAGDAFMKVTGRVPAARATLVFRFGVVNRKIIELRYQTDPA
jgi:hypothetical protein